MIRNVFFVFLFTLCFSASSQQRDGIERIIQVSGNGTVTAAPDLLRFNVYLEEQGKLASKLNQTISVKSTQIVNFLSKNGVEPKDIQSMRVDLRPYFRRTKEGQVQDGYVLSRVIRISLRDFEAYPGILDGVLKFGANRIDGFSYLIEDQEQLYLKALEIATKNAKVRAEKLARSLNVGVGEVVSINESSGYSPVPMRERSMLMADSATGMSAGTINISASLNVLFALTSSDE